MNDNLIQTDVLVVGAGPAGSTAAKHAALGGAKTILVDKKSEIGTPKRCAEGVYTSGLEKLGIKPNHSWISQEINSVKIISSDYKHKVKVPVKKDFNMSGYILERKVFDKYMAMDAARARAEIRIKTFVKFVEKTQDGFILTLENMGQIYQLKTNILILADGVESRLSRLLNINTENTNKVFSTAQFEMCNLNLEDDRCLEFYYNKYTPGGYAWIFPKGEKTANVGLGIDSSYSGEEAYNLLLKFIKNCPVTHNGQVVELNIGGIPSNGLKKKIHSNNLLIVGDAAGQVNPLTGGGLITGMHGGMLAGKVAANSIANKDYSEKFLSIYETEYRKLYEKPLSDFKKVKNYIYSLKLDEIDSIIASFQDTDFKNATKKSLFKKLVLVSPKAIFKLGKLIK